MVNPKRFPAWLRRRSYFTRMGRWAKPRKAAAPRPVEAPEPAPSNIIAFRDHAALGRRPAGAIRSSGAA